MLFVILRMSHPPSLVQWTNHSSRVLTCRGVAIVLPILFEGRTEPDQPSLPLQPVAPRGVDPRT